MPGAVFAFDEERANFCAAVDDEEKEERKVNRKLRVIVRAKCACGCEKAKAIDYGGEICGVFDALAEDSGVSDSDRSGDPGFDEESNNSEDESDMCDPREFRGPRDVPRSRGVPELEIEKPDEELDGGLSETGEDEDADGLEDDDPRSQCDPWQNESGTISHTRTNTFLSISY